MSAFIVDKSHIDAMVQLALNGPEGCNSYQFQFGWSHDGRFTRARHEEADSIGRMLWRENVRSIHARYPDTIDGSDMPGPCDFTEVDAELYSYPTRLSPQPMRPMAVRPTAVEGLKIISHYEYQACETSDFQQTEAYAFCDALRAYLINELPGYRAAPWGWEERHVKTSAVVNLF